MDENLYLTDVTGIKSVRRNTDASFEFTIDSPRIFSDKPIIASTVETPTIVSMQSWRELFE